MSKDNVGLTVAQRKIYLDALDPVIQKIAYVIDKDHKGYEPEVQVNLANRSYDIICTEFMKFNMQRRDDSPQWQSFFDQLKVPRELPPRESEQTEYEWLSMAARSQKAKEMQAAMKLDSVDRDYVNTWTGKV
ncbi:hypothetical protein AVT69_gp270 [Pseudomonas phage PhiPA3]|uniref:Uncharacterized protein 272 n=1 Tax=Pseudomonas phage PhiPA3 TaxID=998086 RepID=F8SJA9_BPPA3|nr:hypothetical protein AVT69_gp270 [Pseudomonas phage PhiPA3]AEH03695.1 hypothetical protein [Pseudomonas phage PhiPA3]